MLYNDCDKNLGGLIFMDSGKNINSAIYVKVPFIYLKKIIS